MPKQDQKDSGKILKFKETLNNIKCGQFYEAEVIMDGNKGSISCILSYYGGLDLESERFAG